MNTIRELRNISGRQVAQWILSTIMLLALIIVIFGSDAEAQRAGSVYKYDLGKGTIVSFTALSTTGTTETVFLDAIPAIHAVQVVTTGAPAACTYDTEVSLDGLTFFKTTTATSCTTSGTITYTANQPWTWVRFNLTALSASSTAKFTYTGAR